MSYGVINGLTGSYRITPLRTKLPIATILPASDMIPGVTPDTFVVQLTGLYQIDFSINLSSPSRNALFTLELFNVTTNSLVQQRTGVVPGQSFPSDLYFGFDWNNLSVTDEYAFYITADPGTFYEDYAFLISNLNFRAVVQMFGGSGVLGAGTAGKIPLWTAHDTVGDSIMTQAATVITVAGSVNLANTNTDTFLSFTDGQNVPVSAANTGRIRYNTATQTFQFSENGGAWADLSGVGPGTVNYVAKFTAVDAVGNAQMTDDGAGAFTLRDGTNQVLAFGTTAAAFSVTNTAGVNVTFRARDANGGNRNGGNLILQAGEQSGNGVRGTVQCPGLGTNSTVIGTELFGAVTQAKGGGDVAIGLAVEITSTGGSNVAIGNSHRLLSTSQRNVVLGSTGWASGLSTSAADNVSIGTSAHSSITSGTSNIAIGNSAATFLAAQTHTIALGRNVGVSANFAICIGSGDAGVTYNNPAASAQSAIAIGPGTTASAQDAIALGANATSNEANVLAIWRTLKIGTAPAAFSVAETAGVDVTIRARDANTALAANFAGGSLILRPGERTGTGAGGSVIVQGNVSNDLPTYGAEFLGAAGWTSVDWTGSWAAGWTHTPGNTTVLSQSTAAVVGVKYQISYTVTGRTAGTFSLTFGGETVLDYATRTFGPTATGVGGLQITPSNDFDGTIVLSIKAITAGSTALSVWKNSGGVVCLETRSNLPSNIFIGVNAGLLNTTGYNNSAIGVDALAANTTGRHNTSIGYISLQRNTTGVANTACGYGTLSYNTTGDDNAAFAYGALVSNTTGSHNTACGSSALASNLTGNNSVGIGYSALFASESGSGNVAIGFETGDDPGGGGTYTGATTTASYQTLVGTESGQGSATQRDGITCVGYRALADGANAVALGWTSNAVGDWAVAIGPGSTTNAYGAVSIGAGAGATALATISIGAGAQASAQEAIALGGGSGATAADCTALGPWAQSRITKTINISGLDCARNDDGQTDYWLYYGSRVNIVYGPEVDFLGAPVGVSVTIPANSSAWIEEVGWIVSGFNVDGGALTVQPTIEFGITGTLAKYLAPVPTTLLTSLGKRERYWTLLADDGETTALTANMTVAGTIAGGGASVKYKGRPYWVLRAAENSSSPS